MIGEIEQWYFLTQRLSELKIEEMKLRKKIFKDHFSNSYDETITKDLNDGFKLKGKHSLRYTIDESMLETVGKILSSEAVAMLVDWKPKLVKAKYNTLSEYGKVTFDRALIIKPATPTLELIVPG